MFVLDALKFVPDGFVTWILKMDKLPWMEKLRENRTCVHEVAAKLIEDKRQELKDGTSRRDILSVLGSSHVSTMRFGLRCNFWSSSQGKFLSATRLATER